VAVVVITGASSGIGRATSIQLGARGDTVILVARRRERLEEVADAVRSAGGQPVIEALDANDGDAVIAMASRIVERHGAPDAIVNSAGAGDWRYVEDTPPDELDRMLAAPFKSAFHMCHAFLPAMLEARRGVIIHVNSPACSMPWPGSTGYAAARWALRGLHEAMSQDLHGTGAMSCHVVFGEVSSEYFDANPGIHKHIPKVARVAGVLSPDICAGVVVRVIDKPKRDVWYPFMIKLFARFNALSPWLVRTLVRLTGRKR